MDEILQATSTGLRSVVREVLGDRDLRTRVATKADGSLITAADTKLQQAIRAWLDTQEESPALLAEEQAEETNQALIDTVPPRLWVLDPLDGTTNLASGIPYTAVSLALLEAGRPILGVVYDPDRDECFTARHGAGAWCNGEPLRVMEESHPATLAECVALIDFKRLVPELAATLAAQHPFRSQRNFGSVALDWCWLAAGRGQLYLHGRARLWDYVAGWLIASEAGIVSQTLDGDTVFTCSLQGRSAMAAASPSLLGQWGDWIAGAL